jgi:hypothetical protein
VCTRFQANPEECRLVAVKRILRYLVHIPNLGLRYPKGSTFDLLGYSDSDYAGCKVDQKSTTGTCQFLGRSLVSCSSKKQISVALSTSEAEYICNNSNPSLGFIKSFSKRLRDKVSLNIGSSVLKLFFKKRWEY